MTRRSRYAYLNTSRTLVFDTAENRDIGRAPYGHVILLWNVGNAYYGQGGQAFQCRVICADGTLWSGRSTRGHNYLTLHAVSPTGKTAEAMRKRFPRLFLKAG